MRPIRKRIKRLVTVRSSDPALSSTQWVVTISPTAVSFRRKGQSEEWGLTWRSLIGTALVHDSRRLPVVKEVDEKT